MLDAPDSRRLDSWKEIAKHLGRDVRTVVRWERDRGLPVHRVPGGKLSRVFAHTRELDEWLHRAGEPPVQADDAADHAVAGAHGRARRFITAAAAAASVLVLAATVVSWRAPSKAPVSLALSGSTLTARDAAGREVWRYVFDRAQVAAPAMMRWSFVGDLGRRGVADALATVQYGAELGTPTEERLLRFSDSGRLLWSYEAPDRLRFADGEYGPPWSASDLHVFNSGGAPRIGWSVHHYTWWPSLFVTLSPDGQRLGTFVNSGWIARAASSKDGRHLLLAGMTNAHRSYFLAVLDADDPTGASPEPSGSKTECLTCPPGRPLHYYVFPRTDVSGAFAYPLDAPSLTLFDDGSLLVHLFETPSPGVGTSIYEYGSDFRIRELRASDAYDEWHRKLTTSGALAHAPDDCPDRRAREIRHWTPGGGWETVRLAVK